MNGVIPSVHKKLLNKEHNNSHFNNSILQTACKYVESILLLLICMLHIIFDEVSTNSSQNMHIMKILRHTVYFLLL